MPQSTGTLGRGGVAKTIAVGEDSVLFACCISGTAFLAFSIIAEKPAACSGTAGRSRSWAA